MLHSSEKCDEIGREFIGIWEGTPARTLLFFFRFLRPPDERKNPDWPELVRST